MNAFPISSRLLAVLLILCAVAAYAPAIGAGYIWDDDTLLLANPQMRDTHGLAEIWQGRNSHDYTPLTLTGFWIGYQLWGNDPVGYHIINILLHVLSALLLWRILELLGIPGAWLAALLFAIHPVNAASVAWVAELKNTLSAALFFAAIYAYLRGRKTSDCRFDLGSIALFALGGLSKGSVVTLPLVLLGCSLWTERKITQRDIKAILPFVLISLVIAWLTIHYQSRAVDYGLVPTGFPYRLARAGFAICFYLKGIFWPIGLNPMAAQWLPDLHSAFAWMPLIGMVILAGLLLWKCKSWGRPLLFAGGYYLLMLLPVLGFVWMVLMQETPAADWWQYTAAPGIFACIAAGIAIVLKKTASKNARTGLLALVCILCGLLFVQTWRRCAIYESMETYCLAVVADNPHAWSMQNNLGIVLKRRDEYAEAISHYRQAISDNPRFMEAHNNLGNALSSSGDLPGAEAQYRTALQLIPGKPDILANLADVCFQQGKIHEAFAAQADAIKADRANPVRYNQFGQLLAESKHFEQAAVCFKQALALSPGDIAIQINLVHALIAAGKKDEARAVCGEALQSAHKTGNAELVSTVEALTQQCH